MAPAFRLLRRLDHLDEGEAGTKLPEGTYPVGAVEDEVTVFVRGDYYGVSLLAFGFHALPQTGQAVFIVGFVEDKTARSTRRRSSREGITYQACGGTRPPVL